MTMSKCKNCKYYCPCKNKLKRGKCAHPERKDDKLVYYFGSLKETDFCALFETKGVDDERR